MKISMQHLLRYPGMHHSGSTSSRLTQRLTRSMETFVARVAHGRRSFAFWKEVELRLVWQDHHARLFPLPDIGPHQNKRAKRFPKSRGHARSGMQIVHGGSLVWQAKSLSSFGKGRSLQCRPYWFLRGSWWLAGVSFRNIHFRQKRNGRWVYFALRWPACCCNSRKWIWSASTRANGGLVLQNLRVWWRWDYPAYSIRCGDTGILHHAMNGQRQ